MLTNWCKVLDGEGRSIYRHYEYSLPHQRGDGTWEPGEWTPAVVPYIGESGWHITRQPYGEIVIDEDSTLWEVEWRGANRADTLARLAACESIRLTRPMEHAPWWPEVWRRVNACDQPTVMSRMPQSRHVAVIHAPTLEACYARAWGLAHELGGSISQGDYLFNDVIRHYNVATNLYGSTVAGLAASIERHFDSEDFRICREKAIYAMLPVFSHALTDLERKHVELRFEARRRGYGVYGDVRSKLIVFKVVGR